MEEKLEEIKTIKLDDEFFVKIINMKGKKELQKRFHVTIHVSP